MTSIDEKIYLEKMDIFLTKEALTQFKISLTQEEKQNPYVRVGLHGGGCSGMRFNLQIVEESDIDQEDDIIEEIENTKFVMDIFSQQYLCKSTIDYLTSLNESGFKFLDVKKKTSCGCGSSFSV